MYPEYITGEGFKAKAFRQDASVIDPASLQACPEVVIVCLTKLQCLRRFRCGQCVKSILARHGRNVWSEYLVRG